MHSLSILAFVIYIGLLITIALVSKRKHQTSNDFLIGSRKMNFWVTALAAHASDMSSWIFMAYPAVIFSQGTINIWVAIGLTTLMFLNWQLIAPRIRKATEAYNSLTLSSFFESRFSDTTGLLRVCTALISFVYFTVYISAGLSSLGLLLHSLLGLPYLIGITAGIFIVVPYLFIGGYVTLAWTDFFQGIFLMIVIMVVPFYALNFVGGWANVGAAIAERSDFVRMVPDYSWRTIFSILFLSCSWGLGYFGQPQIITKFMGINDPSAIYKSKWIGISWQIISLIAATSVGLIAVAFFAGEGISDNQLIFINMALALFPPFIAGFILCAILGATITTMDSQILVLATNLTEDFYKKIIRKSASSKELLLVSRLSIFFVAFVAYLIACNTTQTIFNLVSYAWFGMGASFGPLLIFALYSKKANRFGAGAGVIIGALVAGIWPLIDRLLPMSIPTLIPGFAISSFTIWFVSAITYNKHSSEKRDLI